MIRLKKFTVMLTCLAFLLQPLIYAQENALPDTDVAEAMALFGEEVVTEYGSIEAREIAISLSEAADQPVKRGPRAATSGISMGQAIAASEIIGLIVLNWFGPRIIRHEARKAVIIETEYRWLYLGINEEFESIRREIDRNPTVGAQAARRAWSSFNRFVADGLEYHIGPLHEMTRARMRGIRFVIAELKRFQRRIQQVIRDFNMGRLVADEMKISLEGVADKFVKALHAQRKELEIVRDQGTSAQHARHSEVVVETSETPYAIDAKMELAGIEEAIGRLEGFDIRISDPVAAIDLLISQIFDINSSGDYASYRDKFEDTVRPWIDLHVGELSRLIDGYDEVAQRTKSLRNSLDRIQQANGPGEPHIQTDAVQIRSSNAPHGYLRLEAVSENLTSGDGQVNLYEGYAMLNDIEKAIEGVREGIKELTIDVKEAADYRNHADATTIEFHDDLKRARGHQPAVHARTWKGAGYGALFLVDALLAFDLLRRFVSATSNAGQSALGEAKTAEDFMQQYARHTLAPLMDEEEVDESYDIATEFYYDHFQPLLAAIHYEAFPELYAVQAGDAS